MRSPRAACAAAKYLILLALGALSQVSASDAATKCPSGQILRVSQGICVPKAQNLAILSKHGTTRARHGEDASAPVPTGPRQDEAASPKSPNESPVEVAQRDMPQAQVQPTSHPAPQAEPASSPFGSLFVGAFHSTVSAGLSAIR